MSRVSFWKGADLVVMARVTDTEDTNILQADISTVTVKVFDSAGSQVGTSTTPSVASTVFDTLQTDNGWPYTTGHNFRYTVAGATYFTGTGNHSVVAYLTPTSGSDIIVKWPVKVLDPASS